MGKSSSPSTRACILPAALEHAGEGKEGQHRNREIGQLTEVLQSRGERCRPVPGSAHRDDLDPPLEQAGGEGGHHGGHASRKGLRHALRLIRDLRALDAAGAIKLIARYDDMHGLLDVEELSTLVPDLAERTTYACGPAGLLEAIEAHHSERDLPLYVEQFRTKRIEAGEGGTVSFAKSGVTFAVDGATPILDAAEEAGVLMPSGCRMGICFGCVLPLTEGAVRDLRNGEITVASPGDGVAIQTCISAAAAECVIDN
mgnify:CR=1 FL=1